MEALVWERALGHGAKVVAAVGLPLVKQSPASPELNPAERVFEALRREVEGEVSGTIENKMAVVARDLEAMAASPEGVQRLTGWSWTRDTLARLPQEFIALSHGIGVKSEERFQFRVLLDRHHRFVFQPHWSNRALASLFRCS